jgi:hypothetical protein
MMGAVGRRSAGRPLRGLVDAYLTLRTAGCSTAPARTLGIAGILRQLRAERRRADQDPAKDPQGCSVARQDRAHSADRAGGRRGAVRLDRDRAPSGEQRRRPRAMQWPEQRFDLWS